MTDTNKQPTEDTFTQDIKDLIRLATTDFDKFYKETEKSGKAKGDSSRAASSGNCSKAASSGDSSTAASSGDFSTAASSGNFSAAASSGNCSMSASSGDASKAASSGNCSIAASSGDFSTAASSGDCSTAASSGNYSKAASSGDSSKAASSGYYSKAASSGNNSACTALGYRAAVKGDLGNLIMASEYRKDWVPLGGKADIIDGKKIKANCWYIVEGGLWVEVDFTDGIFSRVISTKGGAKKVKDDNGNVMFVVTDGNHSAHGKTIKEARDAMAFKTADRDVSSYKNMPMDTKKTPDEWAVVYHVITGACQSGCQSFMQSKGKLKKKYTLADIIEATKGQYLHARFVEVVKGEAK